MDDPQQDQVQAVARASSRRRLSPRSLPDFAGETLFDAVGRVVCEADCLPRKELFESWAVASRVRRRVRGRPILDLAAGHGLVAWLLLLLDPTAPGARCVDRRRAAQRHTARGGALGPLAPPRRAGALGARGAGRPAARDRLRRRAGGGGARLRRAHRPRARRGAGGAGRRRRPALLPRRGPRAHATRRDWRPGWRGAWRSTPCGRCACAPPATASTCRRSRRRSRRRTASSWEYHPRPPGRRRRCPTGRPIRRPRRARCRRG